MGSFLREPTFICIIIKEVQVGKNHSLLHFFNVSACPCLIISYQQLVDRFSLLGYGAYGTENAQTLDMETVIQVIEECIGWVLLAGIGV